MEAGRSAVVAAVRGKLKQHAGLADPLVVVLDLSSPITEDHEIAAMLYGRMTTTMLDASTPVNTTRDRKESIWPDPVLRPPSISASTEHATEGTAVDGEWNVSAITAKSLTWDRSAFAKAPTRHPRRMFENEAVAWQQTSQRGAWAAFCSHVDQSSDQRARRKTPTGE